MPRPVDLSAGSGEDAPDTFELRTLASGPEEPTTARRAQNREDTTRSLAHSRGLCVEGYLSGRCERDATT